MSQHHVVCRFVTVEPVPAFPAELPLSASLLSSQKAMDRCRQIILAHSSHHSTTAPAALRNTAAAPSSAMQQPSGTTTAAPAEPPASNAAAVAVMSAARAISSADGSSNDANEAIGGEAASCWPVPAGYLVPGCPGEHDVDVAVKLGLPLLGPTPQLAQVLASRIGSR